MSAVLDEVNAGTDEVFVGRQAIYDHKLRVSAYELLFRSGDVNAAFVEDGDVATAEVINTAFMDIGLGRLAEQQRVFINVTREFLLQWRAAPMPPDRVVLEILEDVEVDAALICAVREHVDAGFTVALDDFFFEERWRPLIQLSDIVKIDVMALGLDGAREQVRILEPYRKTLLAEKVETRDEYEALVEMGFDLFQGYFLSKPKIVSGRRLPSGKLALVRLLAVLQDPDACSEDVDRLIAQDVALSFKLLRFINSAAFALASEVDSIQRAIILLGLEPLKRWASLLAMASFGDQPSALVRIAMVRARMCEQLAEACGHRESAAAFTVGLLSTLDLLVGSPLQEVLAELPLSTALHEAILHHGGPFGEMLDCVIAYEQCDWEHARMPGLLTSEVRDIFADSVQWTSQAAASAGAIG